MRGQRVRGDGSQRVRARIEIVLLEGARRAGRKLREVGLGVAGSGFFAMPLDQLAHELRANL